MNYLEYQPYRTMNFTINKFQTIFIGVWVIFNAISSSGQDFGIESQLPYSMYDLKYNVLIDKEINNQYIGDLDVSSLLEKYDGFDYDVRYNQPLQFAEVIDKDYLMNEGKWENVPDGRIWRLKLSSEEALSINLKLKNVVLPGESRIWLVDKYSTSISGPYNQNDVTEDGILWTSIVEGNTVVLELFEDSNFSGQSTLTVDEVNYGFIDFSTGSSGNCQKDVVCAEGDNFRDPIRAVAWFTIEGRFLGSGTLLNNTSGDETPFFLTSDHCFKPEFDPASTVIYWNYQSATCGDRSGSLVDNQIGAQIRARRAVGDFVLLELKHKPFNFSNVYYAGWDRKNEPVRVVSIHHPKGDVKSINTSSRKVISTIGYNSDIFDKNGSYWMVNWRSGANEPVSSGSGMFDSTSGLLIGSLDGGKSGCDDGDQELNDWYAKFNFNWDGGGEPNNSLKYWLDPLNTNAENLSGKNPEIASQNLIISRKARFRLNEAAMYAQIVQAADFVKSGGELRLVEHSEGSSLMPINQLQETPNDFKDLEKLKEDFDNKTIKELEDLFKSTDEVKLIEYLKEIKDEK